MHDDVLHEYLKFIEEVVERPHPAMNNMPICPFAKKARKEGKVEWHVHPFHPDHLADFTSANHTSAVIDEFCSMAKEDVLVVIHPYTKWISPDEIAKMKTMLEAYLPPGFISFATHPDAPVVRAGFEIREPYANFQIIRRSLHRWGVDILLKTRYYDHWTDEQLRDSYFPYSLPRDLTGSTESVIR